MRKVTKKRNSSSTNLNKHLVSLRNLAGRVAALEEIVQQLVTWTKVELLCKDDNVNLDDDDKEEVGVKLPSGGRKLATAVKNLTIPSKLDVVTSSSSSRSVQSGGCGSAISYKRAAVANKSTGGVPKHRIKPVSAPPIQEQRNSKIFHQLFCDGGGDNENMEEEQEIQIKAEPVIVDDDVEFDGVWFGGIGLESSDENQQDNCHDQFVVEEEEGEDKQINVPCFRKRTRKGRDFYIDGNDKELENEILPTPEEEAEDDYHPGSEPEEHPDSEPSDLITTSSKKRQRTRRPPKKKKTMVKPYIMEKVLEIVTSDPLLKVFPSTKGYYHVATYKGFFYTFDKDGTDKSIFRCCERIRGCKGRIYLSMSRKSVTCHDQAAEEQHNHGPDPSKCNSKYMMSKVKTSAGASRGEGTASLIATQLQDLPSSSLGSLPKMATMKRIVQYVKAGKKNQANCTKRLDPPKGV